MPKIERALLSVTDKTGLVDFARTLRQFGIELISTGGTARLLRDHQLPVRDVSELTGFPEMLDGRVKTIDPHIAGGILAVRSNPDHMRALAQHGIQPIQMVVVNLYEFEKYAADDTASRQELIENIDIGGPTMIRAAAKNFNDVAVIVSPDQYLRISDELRETNGSLSSETHWNLAKEAFARTAAYDSAIADKLATLDDHIAGGDELPETLRIQAPRRATLRYGENPHQQAALYRTSDTGIGASRQLHGKELSFNNLVDLDAAWQLVQEFEQPAAAIIKHTNPCGCSEQASLTEAYQRAYEADPVSAYGGVLAFNRAVDEDTAAEVSKLFVEAVAAPAFDEAALAILKTKKNLRLVEVPSGKQPEIVIQSITGGILAQTADSIALNPDQLQIKTARVPTPNEMRDLLFAWKVAKHVKSNAIVYARNGQLLSAGAGQMSRVDAVKVGAMKAVLPLKDCVVASDAFFPFPDGLEEAARAGAAAFIQPGGSVRDADVIAAADRLHVAMVFTGIRHFRH